MTNFPTPGKERRTLQERPTTQAVSFAHLDAFIASEARASGVNVQEAFPFRIEGTPTRLDWHVIDGSKIPTDAHGHEAHMRTAVRLILHREGRPECESLTPRIAPPPMGSYST